jgi:hypothetical protein
MGPQFLDYLLIVTYIRQLRESMDRPSNYCRDCRYDSPLKMWAAPSSGKIEMEGANR